MRQHALSPDREGMLSIGKLGIGQETYYLEKVAEGAEDYYFDQGELELSGQVGPSP